MTDTNDEHKALSLDDMYGSSIPLKPNPEVKRDASGNILYEETPIINQDFSRIETPKNLENKLNLEKDLPDPLSKPEITAPIPRHQINAAKPNLFIKVIGKMLVIIFLFILGIFLSTLIQPILTNFSFTKTKVVNNKPDIKNIPEPEVINTTVKENTFIYEIKGSDGKPTGITVELPGDILEPICDGGACPSYGTYLKGGTRLTFSLKKFNTPLVKFSESIITDASGKKFETIEASAGGSLARKYVGTFTGMTVGGYRFNRMHGLMVLVDEKTLFELNHFTPEGINADFETDEQVFDRIIKSLVIDKL